MWSEARKARLVRVLKRLMVPGVRLLPFTVCVIDGVGEGGRLEVRSSSCISGAGLFRPRLFSRVKLLRNGSKLNITDDVSSTTVDSSGGAELGSEEQWADAMGVGMWVGGGGKSRQRLVSSALGLTRDER